MTSIAFPPNIRTEIGPGPILAGDPVSAVQTWQLAAAGVNYLNGAGAMLIPAAALDMSKSVTTTSMTFHFRAFTRKQAVARIWCVQLAGTTSAGGVATINANAYGALTVDVPAVGTVSLPFLYTEVLGSQASAATDLSVVIASSAGKSIQVVSISCWEQWRPALEPASGDRGVNAESIRPRERIYLGNYPTQPDSVTGIYDALTNCDARRVGLFHWSVDTAAPATRNGAYQSILGLLAPILTRKLTNGATTGTVYWSAYAKVNAGNGDVQITTSHSAVTDSVNVTATGYAWTTDKAISVDCEDLTAADGRRATSWDEIDVQIRGNGGNTLSIAAFSVWEQP